MSERILITGVTGFVGPHLVRHLQSLGKKDLWGISRQPPAPDRGDLQGVTLLRGDLDDHATCLKLLGEIRPTCVFHLAGHAPVAGSWDLPTSIYARNIWPQVNLLESLRQLKLSARVLIVGSSEEYGDVPEKELPALETTPLRPNSPYAVSKVAQDLSAYQYFKSYGIHTIRARAFNHTGPGRPERYAISGFCQQLIRIQKGRQSPVLKTGDLSVERDFLDVRDVVRAYQLLMERGEAGEVYNICSGVGRSLRSILDTLIRLTGIPVQVDTDPSRLRPSDAPRLFGDPGKLFAATGWRPLIPFEKTLQDLLQDWAAREP